MAQKQPELLQKPLYIFDLPEELLLSLTLKDNHITSSETSKSTPESVPAPTPTPTEVADSSATKATSCNLCNLTFPTLQEQRNHVRSDLHNYNLKQKIRGLKPATEAQFEALVGDLDESISGSESEETESEEEGKTEGKDPTLVALLKKQAKISAPEEDDGLSRKSRKMGAGNAPLIWFSSPLLPSNTALGIYKAIFSKVETEEPLHLVDALRRKQIPSTPVVRKALETTSGGVSLGKKSPHYFLCMIGGGHFAAMIISLAPKVSKKHTGHSERQADVLAHKTFHRYTTRRKQGGAQSANDSAKGAAHSAGSALRRYNETALTAEVRALLVEWKALIDSAELIFIRATGNTNRQTLFGPGEDQVLRQNDPRNRSFPFTTRRATQAELMRAFVELTRVKVSQIGEAALAAAAAAEREKEDASRSAPAKINKPPKLSEEEETATMHTNQLQTLIKRSKAPALLNYIQSNSLSPNFEFFPAATNHHSPTPLHLAASSSSPALVTTLLTKANADPALRNEDGKTAFEIAGDRATRDAFRLARHTLGESKWSWESAGIGSALTPAEISKRAEAEKKEKLVEDKKEAERRKAEVERLKREDEGKETEKVERRIGKGRVLVEKTGAERREEEGRGMTPETRARLERERRARAAEARLAGGGGGR